MKVGDYHEVLWDVLPWPVILLDMIFCFWIMLWMNLANSFSTVSFTNFSFFISEANAYLIFSSLPFIELPWNLFPLLFSLSWLESINDNLWAMIFLSFSFSYLNLLLSWCVSSYYFSLSFFYSLNFFNVWDIVCNWSLNYNFSLLA